MVRFALIAALLFAASAQACKKDGLYVFPAPGAVIPTNSRFIIEGVGAEQRRVDALVGQELVLRAQDDAITVKVMPGWKSALDRTAVVLKPNHVMKPNTQYSLMVDAYLPNYEVLNDDAADSMTWKTGERADDKAPRYQLKPSISEGSYAVEGGIPVKRLTIHTSLVEESPSYLVVTIRRARGTSAPQTYVVPLRGGEAYIGNDACSGSFAFDDGRAYKATIELFDAAGNLAPAEPPIEFQAPRQVK